MITSIDLGPLWEPKKIQIKSINWAICHFRIVYDNEPSSFSLRVFSTSFCHRHTHTHTVWHSVIDGMTAQMLLYRSKPNQTVNQISCFVFFSRDFLVIHFAWVKKCYWFCEWNNEIEEIIYLCNNKSQLFQFL